MRAHRTSRRSDALAALVVGSLFAVAACGGSDDDGGAAATDPSEGSDPSGEETPDDGGPVHGGHLVYGIEADTANPFAPYSASYATGGYVLLNSLTDTLFTVTPEGDIAPMLFESYEANDDFTEWTFQVREGIEFHDGTPLDGAAVEFNIETCQYSPTTASALASIDDVSSSGQEVTITTHTPQVALPYAFVERQCAHMMSPTWMGSLEDVPQRVEDSPVYDAELAATPADGNAQEPVGLGAFVFESYTPGNGNSFKAVRNENYWRGPNGITGENLPFLDSVEAVVAVDEGSRSNGLRSGEFDLMHTSNTDAVSRFVDDDDFDVITSSRFGDTHYFMLNVADGDDDPDGQNADSPLLNVHCRRALAFAMDKERLVEERQAGLVEVANGPFGPGQPGYLEDTGYPGYDIDEANVEMDQCLSELGTDSIEFGLSTTNDPFNVETNTLILSMWTEAFGDKVSATVEAIEQGQYIGLAVVGMFDGTSWRSHGGVDPATQAVWWQSASAGPIGSPALNFGRIRNADIDAALDDIRSEGDQALRTEAAEDLNRIFGEQVYNLWWAWAVWGIVQQPYVNGVESNVLLDGGEGVGLAFAGLHQMNQIWCDGGVCE